MAAGRIVLPSYFPARDRNARLVSGALLTVYVDNSTTKAVIYSDIGMATAIANPVEANSSGQFPAIFCDAGTVDVPVLYGLGVSGPDGESIGNPAIFYGWQPSVDGETAMAALASQASEAAQAYYEDIVALEGIADNAIALATRAAKTANGSDFTDPVAVTENIQFQRNATGSVPTGVNLNLSNYAVKAGPEFGVIMDGTDKSTNLAASITEALTNGKELWIDADDEDGVPINTSMMVRRLANLPYQAAFRRGLTIRGTGSGGTVFDSSVANGALFDFSPTDDFSGFKGQLGGKLEGITIRRTTAAANSDGFRMRSLFQFDLSDTHVIGLTGTAYDVVCTVGDLDGSNMVTMSRNRAENCGKFGFDLEATSPHNEISHLTLTNCVASGCGTNQSVAITAITQANPAVVTAAAHGLVNGDRVYLLGVGGMTQVDSFTANTSYVVASATTNTFALTGIDSTAFSPFTSGGRAVPFILTSGGWKWRGQKFQTINCGGVQNKNANLWLPGGAGLSQDFILDFASENPDGAFGILIHGGRNGRIIQPHLYSNQTFGLPNYAGILIDATTSVVRNVIIDQPQMRSTAAETDYRALKVMGPSVEVQTIQWNNPDYKQYDYAGQKRVEGVLFPSCPTEGELVGVSVSALRYRPDVRGNRYPLKVAENATVHGGTRSTTGELTVKKLAPTGITLSNSGLANSTIYDIYIYDAMVSLGRDALEASATAPVQDTTGGSGRWIKTGDDTRTWVGRWATDGSAQWLTGTQNWLNPERSAGAWYWTDSTGDLRTSATLPASDTAGTVVGTQS